MKLDHNSLEKLINPATGSVFLILQKNLGLICGFRLWVETRTSGAKHADICFRFRVQATPDAPLPNGVLKDYFASLFPETKWSKVSSKYGSLLGHFRLNVPVWDLGNIMSCMIQNEIPERLYDYMLDSLRPLDFQFSREDFVPFVNALVMDELQGFAQAHKTSNPDSMVFVTEAGSVSYTKGVVDTPTTFVAPNIEGAGLDPTVYVGPTVAETLASLQASPDPSQVLAQAAKDLDGKILPGGGLVQDPTSVGADIQPTTVPDPDEIPSL